MAAGMVPILAPPNTVAACATYGCNLRHLRRQLAPPTVVACATHGCSLRRLRLQASTRSSTRTRLPPSCSTCPSTTPTAAYSRRCYCGSPDRPPPPRGCRLHPPCTPCCTPCCTHCVPRVAPHATPHAAPRCTYCGYAYQATVEMMLPLSPNIQVRAGGR